MTNEELLEKIRTIVREEVKAETESIKQDMVTKADIKDMATKQDITTLAEDMAGLFHETWAKMDATTERVKIIENHVGIADPNNN